MFFSFSSRYFSLSLLICGVFASPIFAHALIREATFYSDSFEGGSTANGDIFHQSDYSAAICDIPL